MKVLFAVWELDPFIKIGGLGDVARSLPIALKSIDVDIRIVLPFYQALKLGRTKKNKICQFRLDYAGKREKVEVVQVFHPLSSIPVYLLHNTRYLSVPVFPDTFAFFDKAIVETIKNNYLSWLPDVVHCNDLHTALVPLLLRENKIPVKTILTIHNLSYQGQTSLETLTKLGIGERKCRVIKWEIKAKKLNFLLEGIIHADIVTTVSPTYAREIMTEEFGCGLENILRGKEGRVVGILNGIDDDYQSLIHGLHVKYPNKGDGNCSWEKSKKQNKLFLQKKLGLKIGDSIPLLSFIGRFDPRQKGIDILHKMLRRINPMKYEFVILGTGDINWEERFQWLAKFYPKNISCNFKFDEVLAHQIYAASDFMLIPSKFEPCGLIQMIAMFFGTIPIAHKTGGLIDSIRDDENGFLFDKYSSEALEKTIKKAVGIWNNDKSRYKVMVENVLATDFSWRKSAGEYLNLYQKLVLNEL